MEDSFLGWIMIGQGGMVKIKEDKFRLDIRRKLFTVRLVRHWNRLPRVVVVVRGVQGQAGWGLGCGQLDLVDGIPVYCRGVGTRRSLRSFPTQSIQ